MKPRCPTCVNVMEVNPQNAWLIQDLFSLIIDKYILYLICDFCGDELLRNYKDTYGIGV